MYDYKEFKSLAENLSDIISKVDDATEVLEIGAKEFVKDLLKLPKPKSKITKSDYTHLIDSFCHQINGNEVEVGWGVYWGRMVEEGTSKTKVHAHMKPTFEKNKERYYKKMIDKILN